MLTNFCSHQMDVKKKESRHWDIALLFSGVNMYGLDHKKRPSWATMGLSTVTGICDDQFGCVIGEIGVRSESNVSVMIKSRVMRPPCRAFHRSPILQPDGTRFTSWLTKSATTWACLMIVKAMIVTGMAI